MAGGLLSAVRGLVDDVLALLQTRLELLTIDLEEERYRLVSLLLYTLVALFLCALGILCLGILVVAAFWDTHRLVALGLLTLVFLGAGGAVAFLAWRQARARPRLFAASSTELIKDRQRLAPP
jgi:uncharacterized membrane protein YqjE